MSLRECYDESGELSVEKFFSYKKLRDSFLEEGDNDAEIKPKKKPFQHRVNEGYDSNVSLESE